jgi:hypothetical protein
MSVLNMAINERAHFIAMLEKVKGFSVKDRYNDAIKYNISANLVDGPKEYSKWKEDEINRLNKQSATNNNDRMRKQAAPNKIEAGTDDDITTRIERTKNALSEALRKESSSPSRYFDFEKDEQDYIE